MKLTIKKIIFKKLKDFKGLNTTKYKYYYRNCNFDRVKLNNELDKIKHLFINKKIK